MNEVISNYELMKAIEQVLVNQNTLFGVLNKIGSGAKLSEHDRAIITRRQSDSLWQLEHIACLEEKAIKGVK